MWQCNSICQCPFSTRWLGVHNELIWILLYGGGHPLSQAAAHQTAAAIVSGQVKKDQTTTLPDLREINPEMTPRIVPADPCMITCPVWQVAVLIYKRMTKIDKGRIETAFGHQDMRIEKVFIHSPWHQFNHVGNTDAEIFDTFSYWEFVI